MVPFNIKLIHLKACFSKRKTRCLVGVKLSCICYGRDDSKLIRFSPHNKKENGKMPFSSQSCRVECVYFGATAPLKINLKIHPMWAMFLLAMIQSFRFELWLEAHGLLEQPVCLA